MSTQTIPVLDLSEFHSHASTRQTFVDQLGHALEDLGFFAIVNHGVDADLIRSAYYVAQQFFALPEAVKRQYEVPRLNGQRGFTSFGREHAKDHPVPDLKEFWHVGRDSNVSQSNVQSDYPANLHVAEVPQFHSVMAQLYAQLEICAVELLKACALYLGQLETTIADMVADGDTILRVIHYPPVTLDTPAASLRPLAGISQRAAPHEDINLITLLCEATDDGLELLQRDGTWLPIRALPGQIIVDSGDMLQQLTNGWLKSTTHRVVNPNDGQQRYSMPYFVHPRREVDLTPLPSCVAKTGKEPLPPITAGDYLMQRLHEIGLA